MWPHGGSCADATCRACPQLASTLRPTKLDTRHSGDLSRRRLESTNCCAAAASGSYYPPPLGPKVGLRRVELEASKLTVFSPLLQDVEELDWSAPVCRGQPSTGTGSTFVVVKAGRAFLE